MLVKLSKLADGRWRLQAYSGEFYGEDVGVADKVFLRSARFGTRRISGVVVATWGLEVYPNVHGTSTVDELNPVSIPKQDFGKEALFFEESGGSGGWWDAENVNAPEPLYMVHEIMAGPESVTYREQPGSDLIEVEPNGAGPRKVEIPEGYEAVDFAPGVVFVERKSEPEEKKGILTRLFGGC